MYTELRVRSSPAPGGPGGVSAAGTPACSRTSNTSLASCMSTQRTTSTILAVVTGGGEQQRRQQLAAVAYQKSPSGPRAVSLRCFGQIGGKSSRCGPIAARREGRPAARTTSGDPVGSMHQTRPRSLRCFRVARKRSPLYTGGHDGSFPRQIAGMARRSSCHSGSGPPQPVTGPPPPPPGLDARCRVPAKTKATGVGGIARDRAGSEARRRPAQRAPRARGFLCHGSGTAPCQEARRRVPTEDQRKDSPRSRRIQPAPIAASVLTSMRSIALKRCWTRNER